MKNWVSFPNRRLRTTTLHNGMILSTLSIDSHDFVFCLLKRPHINEDVFLTYKLTINPLVSRCGTPLPTILPLNKVHHRASLEACEALKRAPLN